MKATGRTLLALVGAMAVGVAVAAPSVEITSVQQQYPWTNTVDIVYNVAGVESETNGYFVVFTPTTSTGAAIPDVNGETSVQVALKGSGVYSTQWYPQTNLQYTACKMTPSVFRGAAKDYMIVDLATGAVTYEPMATQASSNERYSTDEYKTKKLVLRRVPADTYWIGEGDGSSKLGFIYNSRHQVKMDKDYYFAIYELTEAQYAYIMGESDKRTSTLPKAGISYNSARGSALFAATPVSGLFGTLNKKCHTTGFDFPTVSMWEVAARAGSTDTFICGNSASKMDDYAWTSNNSGGRFQKVGQKLPNAWGLYDIFGNGWEPCRDAATETDLAIAQTDGLKPITSSVAKYKSNNRMEKGYGYDWKPGQHTGAYSFSAGTWNTLSAASTHALRVAYINPAN